MAKYSINDVEKLCGIKAHTLRIWEKRFGIVCPKRTVANRRFYLDDDLRLILNISLLNRNGYKISKIAKMQELEIRKLAAELTEVNLDLDDHIEALMFAVTELNDYKFSKIIDLRIKNNGFAATINDTIYPLMDKMTILWIDGIVKGIHDVFVNNIIKQKTLAAIDHLCSRYNPDSYKVMIFLPKGDSYELSLLFLHYFLQVEGMNIMNLGSDMSIESVLEAFDIYQPDYIFTLFNDSDFYGSKLQTYINRLSFSISDVPLLISGNQIKKQKLSLPCNVKILEKMCDLKSQFKINKSTDCKD
ncbi:MAG: MerR family transcriptional regulator [Saprospiraceae bacterium]